MEKELVNYIIELQRNSIGINVCGEIEPAVGNTHFGGVPDVPDDFEWPLYTDQSFDDTYPIAFLAQFNCKELKKYDKDDILPDSGLLSFFYDVDAQPEGLDREEKTGALVYWFENIDDLHAEDYPDELSEDCRFPCLKITMKSEISYPGWEDFDLVHMDMNYDEQMLYCDVLEALGQEDNEEQSKMLGWADVIQENMTRDCDKFVSQKKTQMNIFLTSGSFYCS